jgi:tRNA threonylcarbamoyladenosine biosynthesis protein TsaB
VIILGVESATTQVGCAIGGVEGVLASFCSKGGRRHTETLTPAIRFVCEQARVEMREISAVAVDVGPGLFTGLRVGIATAKAVAQALRVPMLGISSLDLLAFPVRWSNRVIVPVIDARRAEVFTAFYRQVPGGVQRLTAPALMTPNDLASELLARPEDHLLVGDGALRYASVFSPVGDVEIGTPGEAYPSAASLVELAHPRAIREEFVQPWELEPLYLRRSDAEINWDRRESA